MMQITHHLRREVAVIAVGLAAVVGAIGLAGQPTNTAPASPHGIPQATTQWLAHR